MKELLISRWSAFCHIIYLILIFHNVNCFITSTTTSPPHIVPSPSTFIKINHSDAITPTLNRATAVWNTLFVNQKAESTSVPHLPPSLSSPFLSFALYSKAPIRSRAVEHQQPYKVHYVMEQIKSNDKEIESANSNTGRILKSNQQVNENAYLEKVNQSLNKILDLSANFDQIQTAPVKPLKTLSQLSDQTEELGFSDLLQTEESIQNEKFASKPSNYFINIPLQPIPIRICFNTQTPMIKTEENHMKNSEFVKKLFTPEQPDRQIHMVPQRRRIQIIKNIEEHLQAKIVDDFLDGNSNEQNALVNKVTQDLSNTNQKTNFEQKHSELEFQRIQTTPDHQSAAIPASASFLKNQADAINPTEALSTDIELDKIIANLIRQQDFANSQPENVLSHNNMAVFKNDQFSNIQYSKPVMSNSEAKMQQSLSSLSTPQMDQFYQQQTKDGKNFLINDLTALFNTETPNRRMLSDGILSHFVPITTSSPAESIQPMESQQLQSVLSIPTPPATPVKLPKILFAPNSEQQATEGSAETTVNYSAELLEPNESEEDEVVKMLDKGKNKKMDSSMEYVNTRMPIYEANDGLQIVEGHLPPAFHEEGFHLSSAQSTAAL